MSEALFWKSKYGDQLSSDLSTTEKALRDEFCRQYLIDFDPTAAATRCGFHASYAMQYATQFMEEPYTRRKLAEMSVQALKDEEQPSAGDVKHRIVTALYREANYRGPGASHGARIAALSKLSSIYGLEAPAKSEQTITHRGGVMAVPGVVSIDDWEQQALASQAKLTSEAAS